MLGLALPLMADIRQIALAVAFIRGASKDAKPLVDALRASEPLPIDIKAALVSAVHQTKSGKKLALAFSENQAAEAEDDPSFAVRLIVRRGSPGKSADIIREQNFMVAFGLGCPADASAWLAARQPTAVADPDDLAHSERPVARFHRVFFAKLLNSVDECNSLRKALADAFDPSAKSRYRLQIVPCLRRPVGAQKEGLSLKRYRVWTARKSIEKAGLKALYPSKALEPEAERLGIEPETLRKNMQAIEKKGRQGKPRHLSASAKHNKSERSN